MVNSPPSRPRNAAPAIPLLTDRAYERIKHDIITCAIAPGAGISEPQLCLHYRLGKAPVRMALIRLAHDGLVRAIPRRGYMVTPVTLKDIHDVFELRLLLEPAAARMAAGKISTRHLHVLDDACRAGYQPNDVKSISRFLEANKAFHIAIAQATGNSRLANMTAQLHDQMTRLLHLGLGPRNRSEELHHGQRALVKALARGVGETAERISREQIEAARNMVTSAILTSSTIMNLAITGDHA